MHTEHNRILLKVIIFKSSFLLHNKKQQRELMGVFGGEMEEGCDVIIS